MNQCDLIENEWMDRKAELIQASSIADWLAIWKDVRIYGGCRKVVGCLELQNPRNLNLRFPKEAFHPMSSPTLPT